MSAGTGLERLWYGPAWRSVPLWPLALVFRVGVEVRRGLYASGLLRRLRVDVPVVVVGNLTVGGTGKTPVAAWLARQLTFRGHKVGIVLRGYGGSHSRGVRVVAPGDDPAEVGDEALLHARSAPHVVVIGADRVAAARRAVECGADIIVCDDGLQHLRLARDYEIVVVDGERGFGNGWMLPAGPLREPRRRLEVADAVVRTTRTEGGGSAVHPRGPFVADARLAPGAVVNVLTGERRGLEAFRGAPVHAVAAIGNPAAFFASLEAAGLQVQAHPLPDHAPIRPLVPALPADATVLMTEKDAVKCRAYAQPGWWYVELDVSVEREAARELLTLVLERAGLTGAGVKLG